MNNYSQTLSGLMMPQGQQQSAPAGGYQDGSLNQGGSGNPGGAFNTARSPRFNRGGQQQGLGRYRPPTMRFDGQWDDSDGYSYNLPNSFGPSERYGEFRAPARPQFRGRNPGFAGFDPRMGNRGGPQFERLQQQPGFEQRLQSQRDLQIGQLSEEAAARRPRRPNSPQLTPEFLSGRGGNQQITGIQGGGSFDSAGPNPFGEDMFSNSGGPGIGSFGKPFGDQFTGGGFGLESQFSSRGFGRPSFSRQPQRFPPSRGGGFAASSRLAPPRFSQDYYGGGDFTQPVFDPGY